MFTCAIPPSLSRVLDSMKRQMFESVMLRLSAARAAATSDHMARRDLVDELIGAVRDAEAALTGCSAGESDEASRRIGELEAEVTARDEFIATVAHELRNPLTPLIFQARSAIDRAQDAMVRGQALPADWTATQFRRFEQRLHRMLETLDRVLDVSGLASGQIDLRPETLDLGVVMQDVIASFEAELAVAGCDLGFEQQNDATGLWDRVRLDQVCRNLMSNAIRYGAGAPIEVHVSADSQLATLEVADHGIGIAPSDQCRIFERFERGAGNNRRGGFGVGLWVVRNICAAMGGTISVESQPGAGSRFTVTLPRHVDSPPKDA